jgi:ribosomal protein S1
MRKNKVDIIKDKTNQTSNSLDTETHLSKLIDNFEERNIKDESHPFKISDIHEKGFIVKIYGLFGYISFYHMPWNYNNIDSWKSIFPYIKGKILFAEIFKFEKEVLSIILDGKIPQFKNPELFENEKYQGIIIDKTKYGLFVDIGYSLRWECGSLVSLLHKSNFHDKELFEKINVGELIELFFLGYNEDEQIILGLHTESQQWFSGEIEKLIGKILPVNIIELENGRINYLIENKFAGALQVNKIIYPNNPKEVKRAIRKLKDGDTIHCEIIKVNKIRRRLQLRWESLSEIKDILSRDKVIKK